MYQELRTTLLGGGPELVDVSDRDYFPLGKEVPFDRSEEPKDKDLEGQLIFTDSIFN